MLHFFRLQEIVPLNAGNIFGAEDSRPVPKWENIIRETLNRIRPARTKVKCYSDHPSPSKFMSSENVPTIAEEILLESDSDIGEEIHSFHEESNGFDELNDKSITGDMNSNSGVPDNQILDLQKQFSSPKKLDGLNCLRTEDSAGDVQASAAPQKLTRILSSSEWIGLSWPEPPLNLLSQHVLQRPTSFKSIKSFKATKSFGGYSSLKSVSSELQSRLALFAELDFESLMKRNRRSSYVRIVSKQMVGIFLTIWIRRSLRKHIHNLKVSTVGVGVMGYIGNKGSISVSMSIYQTFFCFVCTHLTSGDKDGDELKRNTDVHEIQRRTKFHPFSCVGLPKGIYDHERIIWLGDLNYRINLSYDQTCELISKKEWSKLVEGDQLVRELRKGCAFDGWSEGILDFAPTYKYEMNSEKYCGEDPKAGRRIPSWYDSAVFEWCDRILSYGKGMRLLNYRRKELKLSDHRPVAATYMAEVEVFSPRKLQKALTFTDAEIENEEVVAGLGIDVRISQLRLEQVRTKPCKSRKRFRLHESPGQVLDNYWKLGDFDAGFWLLKSE
ncbi:type IV inositol polyphosphate 5-phosphatase 3 isoform X7 [Populus trichocarpa]|uniref:type IV inositol polyphosphate 5-phosphatase 3 isoform X7 n=1 Tax=Populus trichocarpa TaxID=3694 RepID=UPI0022796CDE|nr:type IV inositol polyphosphate 5-phosphatase 3 isoform X7 [Populus trichocarpa]